MQPLFGIIVTTMKDALHGHDDARITSLNPWLFRLQNVRFGMGAILDYRTLVRADGSRIHAGHSTKDPTHSWGPAGRDLGMYGILLLTEGAGTYRDVHGLVPVAVGTCLILFPGLAHDYGPGPGQRWTEAFFDLRLPLCALLESEGLWQRRQPVWRLDRAAALSLHQLIRDVVAGRLNDIALLQVRLHEFAVRSAPKAATDPHEVALQKARLLLESDPLARIAPQAAAKAAGLGWEVFRRRFRARFGLAPAQWRLRHRLEHAGRMLLEPTATVSSVAAATGFCDPYHFSKRFRNAMGRSPSRFRRDHGMPSTR